MRLPRKSLVMGHDIKVIENFLSDDECDFVIDYFKKSSHKEEWRGTYLIPLNFQPFNLRLSYIRFKYTYRIKKKFKLKKNYDQIVFWPVSSFMKMHRDGKVRKNNEWTSVCYLNDNFEGGKTLIEDMAIKPKKGTLVVFPSKKLNHGVSKVKKSSRYTFISWWRKND